MRFLIDSMLPPDTCELLRERGHEVVTPTDLGAHNLPDETLVELAGADGRVIVTENAVDFAQATSCTVLLVRKEWWPSKGMAAPLADSVDRWARDHPDPTGPTGWTRPTDDHGEVPLTLR